MPSIILTPPRVPLVDPQTGLVDRAWYLFFRSLNNAANDSINNLNVGPSPESLIAGVTAALEALAQEFGTQLSLNFLTSEISELDKEVQATQVQPASVDFGMQQQIDNLQLTVSSASSQIAELQKQIDALALLPAQVTAMLSQLADVNAMNPADGDKLIYSSAIGKWQQDSRSYLMLE
jgi:hypothetical protein